MKPLRYCDGGTVALHLGTRKDEKNDLVGNILLFYMEC